MMSNPIRRDLGFQLLALYLLFVSPVILASITFDQFVASRMEQDIKAADLALARAIALETNTVLENALQSARDLSTYPEVIEADRAGMEALFGVFSGMRPDVNLIYRLDNQGTMIYHYPTGPGSTIGWDFSFREYFQRALYTKQPLISIGRISPTTEQPVATAVMPIWSDDQKFLGVVATNIKLQALSDTLASIAAEHRPSEGFQVSIIDSIGQIIAHPDPDAILEKMNEGLPQISQSVLLGRSGNRIQDDFNGDERLYSYVPIPITQWGVIVSRPTAAAFASSRATHLAILVSIGVFLIVGLIFWLGLSRLVIQPLIALESFSQTIGLNKEVSQEQSQTLENLSRRPDQIGRLSRSLERMDEAIKARLNELSTLLETSASVVSTLDSQVVLDRILEQVERLMDINMCAIVAMDQDHDMFRAQASRGLSKRYTDQLAINPSEPLSVTMRAIRNGEPIQVSDTETDASFAALRPRARSEGYRSVLAVPLYTQHSPPAALLVYRPDPHKFSESEINLLTNFANHAAMAIENSALFARSDMRLQEQTRRLEALIQSFHDGLILEDLSGKVIYANRRIGELVDLPVDQISGAPVSQFLDQLFSQAADPSEAREAVGEVLNGEGKRRVDLQFQIAGQKTYLRLRIFDVTDSAGMRIGRGQILRDITQIRELDRMKSSLVSTVSHELRTPLASIKGYATTLLAEDVEWDTITQREFLEIISNETDRLSNLVNDLLDISRIEAGNLSVSRTECNLEDLIQRAALRAHPSPEERLQIDLPADLPHLYVDPQRVEAVLRNLIENAAKYASDGSPIKVNTEVNNNLMIVRVVDEGPGIPAEYSERIFDSFYRLETGLTRSAPGAGLGLAICQGFIRAHGGDIWLEPRSKGTCVAFSLPLRLPEQQPNSSYSHSLQD